MSFLSQRLTEKLLRTESKQLRDIDSVNDLILCTDLGAFALKTCVRQLIAGKPKFGCLNIGIAVSGGIGDQVIELQWVKVFLEWLSEQKTDFYTVLCFPNKDMGCQLSREFPHVNAVESMKFLKKHKFDVLLSVDYCVRFWRYDRSAVAKYAPALVRNFDEAYKQSLEHADFDLFNYHYQLMNLCLAKGLNRYELIGSVGLCKFDRYTKPFFFVDQERVDATLEKFNLQGKNFITLHSGIGGIPLDGLAPGDDPNLARQKATKVLPESLAEEILLKLKQRFPDFILVQIGEPDWIKFKGADLCLIGETSFAESLDLLSAAKVHIGNDSGLVHIRHAMNKPSVVLWGPVAKDFLGYPEDKNLQGNCQPCMWLTSDWNINCPRGYSDARCMCSISADAVVQAVGSLLAK